MIYKFLTRVLCIAGILLSSVAVFLAIRNLKVSIIDAEVHMVVIIAFILGAVVDLFYCYYLLDDLFDVNNVRLNFIVSFVHLFFAIQTIVVHYFVMTIYNNTSSGIITSSVSAGCVIGLMVLYFIDIRKSKISILNKTNQDEE